MIIVVDERETVTTGFASWFGREGVSVSGLRPKDFAAWIDSACDVDISAVEAVLIGECEGRQALSRNVRRRAQTPVIAMSETRSLEETLDLFEAGVDDVVRKPVHVRELLARIKAIRSRKHVPSSEAKCAGIVVYQDGRDPDVGGSTMPLPRRERRILEFLIGNRGRRVTKSQIFNNVYGVFDQELDETVIESHISKLRKRLRDRLGFDPITSQRFLGYRMEIDPAVPNNLLQCPTSLDEHSQV